MPLYFNKLHLSIMYALVLGSGDRKQIQIPTEIKISTDAQPDTVKNNSKTPDVETKDFRTKALVACGGDFTIYIDNDGRIYATGNTHLQVLYFIYQLYFT